MEDVSRWKLIALGITNFNSYTTVSLENKDYKHFPEVIMGHSNKLVLMIDIGNITQMAINREYSLSFNIISCPLDSELILHITTC